MRGTSKIYSLWCVALTLLCFSCTVMDDLPIDPTFGEQLGGGRVRIALDISTPEAASAMTRSIPVENDTVLNGTFAVFCFDSDDKLLFAVKTGDENTNSNLYEDPDYTDSPAIAWHPNEGSHSGRLYIEAEETPQALHLLVIANVNIDKVAELLGEGDTGATITEGMSLEDVATELDTGLAIDITDEDMQYIPMAGECDLENGITLGSKGSIYMRRSLARFTVRVEYTVDRLAADYEGDIENAPFAGASKVKLVNVNKYAAIYSPSTDEPNISVLNKSDETSDGAETIDMEFTLPEDWQEGFDRDESEIYYKEVVFYVAETLNSRESYTDEDSTNARISLLVSGVYNDYDGDEIDGNCYRLDLIPEVASSAEDEQEFIMRNYNYIFVVHDAVDRGSTSEEEALKLTIPDNFPFDRETGDNGIYVVVQDDEILSITVEWFTTDENQETPYYIGVSSTRAEMPQEQDACIRVKVVTNFVDEEGNVIWSIDPYGIPIVATDGDVNKTYAISFVWDDAAETLWAWLDYPDYVTVGDTYTYYLVAGNVRKKMRITITEGDEEDKEP